MTQVLKQFCVHRTCSNVLKLMVEKYLDNIIVYPNKMGHKHNYFNLKKWEEDGGNEDVGLLISIKHPYSWVVSRAKWTPIDQKRFIPSNLTIKDIDNETLLNWCHSYNDLYYNWFNLPFKKEIVKAEDILIDISSCLNAIAKKWNLSFKSNDIPQLIDNIINPGEHIKSQKFDKDYYIQHKYLNELSSNQIELIASIINWPLFSSLNYYKDRI